MASVRSGYPEYLRRTSDASTGCISGSILGGRWSDHVLKKLKAQGGHTVPEVSTPTLPPHSICHLKHTLRTVRTPALPLSSPIVDASPKHESCHAVPAPPRHRLRLARRKSHAHRLDLRCALLLRLFHHVRALLPRPPFPSSPLTIPGHPGHSCLPPPPAPAPSPHTTCPCIIR